MCVDLRDQATLCSHRRKGVASSVCSPAIYGRGRRAARMCCWCSSRSYADVVQGRPCWGIDDVVVATEQLQAEGLICSGGCRRGSAGGAGAECATLQAGRVIDSLSLIGADRRSTDPPAASSGAGRARSPTCLRPMALCRVVFTATRRSWDREQPRAIMAEVGSLMLDEYVLQELCRSSSRPSGNRRPVDSKIDLLPRATSLERAFATHSGLLGDEIHSSIG